MNPQDVSLDLLHRYNVPGPRYTSYPTAPVWKEDFAQADYARVLEESASAEAPAPLSLYLHLPFCEKLCYFCACTVVITGTDHSPEDSYLTTLDRETTGSPIGSAPTGGSSSSTSEAARRPTSRRSD